MARVNFIELNKALKPIHRNTVKSIERNSARFIYAERSGACKCERCGGEFTLATKHLSYAKCPKCHKTLQVIHSHRRSNNESLHWEVVAKVINPTVVVLRYHLVVRVDGKITESEERARVFFDFAGHKEQRFENSIWDDDWRKGGRSFFRQFGMSYALNRFCCLEADIRPQFFTELRKLDCFKYFDLSAVWYDSYYPTSICHFAEHSKIYEKLIKVGLQDLVRVNVWNYSPSLDIQFNKNENELTKMLGISKNDLNMLKTKPTLLALKYLQRNPNCSEAEFNAFADIDYWEMSMVVDSAKVVGCSTIKVANYISGQGCSASEYRDYVRKLDKAHYNPKNKGYAFPKDFHKALDDVQEEIWKIENEMSARKNELINEIAESLEANKRLTRFFKGNGQYMIYVPKSELEFKNEGQAQDNCVGRGLYAESVAKHETLVFFVREAMNPSAPFITMEYTHGVIVQCMYAHNKRVDPNSNVYSFCSEFANTLKECNILAA